MKLWSLYHDSGYGEGFSHLATFSSEEKAIKAKQYLVDNSSYNEEDLSVDEDELDDFILRTNKWDEKIKNWIYETLKF